MIGVDNDFFTFFLLYGYWILFFSAMLDSIGFPVPGEIFLLMGGSLIGTGKMDFTKAALIAVIGSVIGDGVAYYIGRRGGKRLIDFYCNYIICTHNCSERAENFYSKFGNVAIPVARFAAGVRVFSAPLAGAVKIAYKRFLILDTIGVTVWTVAFLLTGFIFADGILKLIFFFEKIRHGVTLIFLFLIICFMLFKLYRRRQKGTLDLLKIIQKLRSSSKK